MIYCIFLFFVTFSVCLFGTPLDTKEAIRMQQEKVSQAAPDEKGADTETLAMLYLKDQDQENAFRVFLEALNQTKAKKQPETYDVEDYKKAFSIYIDPSSESPQVTAKKLIQALAPAFEEKPERYLLDYFVAIAYANLGKYEEFFKYFYRAFQYYPDHYLAFKTKAVLHIKLLERTRGELERQLQRQAIMNNLLLALEREPYDTTIYKLIISFSPKEMKKEQVQLCLKKIINGNIMIPRSELMFYILEAVDVKETEWGQRFITLAKEWYPKSRLVASAQEYLTRP